MGDYLEKCIPLAQASDLLGKVCLLWRDDGSLGVIVHAVVVHEDIQRTRGEALCHALEAAVVPKEVVVVTEGEVVSRGALDARVARGGGTAIWLVNRNDALVLGSQSVTEVARAIG